MKVKLFVPINCPDGSFRAGDKPDLTDSIAEGLIAGGYAELIEKPAEIFENVEIKKEEKLSAPVKSAKKTKKR